MGPPGSNRHEITLGLAEYFSWRYISVGDLLRKEVEKKTDEAKRIQDCWNAFKLGKLNFFQIRIQQIILQKTVENK